jgi:ribonuclease HI
VPIDKDSLHLYTYGSFRTCAAFGWTLRDASDQEIDSGSVSLGAFCTAFDGEVAAIENGIRALLPRRQPFNHVTVHSDSTAAIARVQHNKRGLGQSRAVNVIRHVQRLGNQGKRVSISSINGHKGNNGNDRADALAGRAAENIPQSTSNLQLVSIAWMNQKVSQSYSEAAILELRDCGKHTIIPPPPKKSAMDKARDSEARISSQLRTNHWLSGVYLKRIGKRAHAGCWVCENRYDHVRPPKMTRTHVMIRCPAFEDVREVCKDPTTGALTWPQSIGALLGNPRWGKCLLKFLEKTTIGKVGPDKIDDEIRRMTRYEEWCNLVEDSELEDEETGSTGLNNEGRRTIIVRPLLRAT